MSASATTASPSIAARDAARTVSVRWIISARDDLVWFIGSVVSSYLLFALYVTGVLPLAPMVVAWAILIDAPHVFGTYSRTYFDREERRRRRRLLVGSLAFFLVGPLMVVLGLGLVFFFVAALWAYWHLVKQHYGFMVLYKKKNGDLASSDNVLDRLLADARVGLSVRRLRRPRPRGDGARAVRPARRVRLRGKALAGCHRARRARVAVPAVAARRAPRTAERAEVSATRGGRPDALAGTADADAGSSHRHRRHSDDLSQSSVSPPDLVSQQEVHRANRRARRATARRNSSAADLSTTLPSASSSASGINCRASTSAVQAAKRHCSRRRSPPSSGAMPSHTITSTRKSGASATTPPSVRLSRWNEAVVSFISAGSRTTRV